MRFEDKIQSYNSHEDQNVIFHRFHCQKLAAIKEQGGHKVNIGGLKSRFLPNKWKFLHPIHL